MTITPAQLEEGKRLMEKLRDESEGHENELLKVFHGVTLLTLLLIAEVERLNAEVSLMARERLTEEAQHRGEYDLTPPKDSTNE